MRFFTIDEVVSHAEGQPEKTNYIAYKTCRLASIGPGDEYQSFVDSDGQIMIIKKVKGAAKGLLRHIKADPAITDEQSLQSRSAISRCQSALNKHLRVMCV